MRKVGEISECVTGSTTSKRVGVSKLKGKVNYSGDYPNPKRRSETSLRLGSLCYRNFSTPEGGRESGESVRDRHVWCHNYHPPRRERVSLGET